VPPYLADCDAGVVADGEVAGLVAAAWVAAGTDGAEDVAAGVVTCAVVVVGAVVVGEAVPQPVMINAHTKRTTRGMSTFFIFISFCYFSDL